MFHELSTIQVSFEQFTDFNGLLHGLLGKKLFLCTRETFLHSVQAETKPDLFEFAEVSLTFTPYTAAFAALHFTL